VGGHSFIFAGGGTGGHLYPGLAIATELGARAERSGGTARCVFVCSNRPLDAEILGKAGVEFIVNPARPIGLRPKALTKFLWTWGRSVREARQVIQAERGTHERVTIVAMGGFVAAPVVQAARVERVPVLLVNLDAVPGKANRLIARRATKAPLGLGAYSATMVAAAYAKKWITVPPVVRREVRMPRDAATCRVSLGLDASRPVLMVTGGSQGARSLNEFVCAFAQTETGRRVLVEGGWQVLHQTGKGEDAAAARAYQAAGIDAVVVPFSDRMGEWWGAADVAIARSGAGNVAEVWATRTPTLFLPYPYHRDDHQKHNARVLVESGGAVLCTDHINAAENLKLHAGALSEVLASSNRRATMKAALEQLGPADGAERVAKALWESAAGRK
jgi:UDP-N-acetylglucosamine--N-acetylmuramyl-(pentapeptide) pyrophosphoryl-undecaprenol N-acetylglucosamine transferase